MSDKSRIIKQDGKTYTFTPGRYGSLTAPVTATSKPLFSDSARRARYVGDALDKVTKKKRKKVTDVGATRG